MYHSLGFHFLCKNVQNESCQELVINIVVCTIVEYFAWWIIRFMSWKSSLLWRLIDLVEVWYWRYWKRLLIRHPKGIQHTINDWNNIFDLFRWHYNSLWIKTRLFRNTFQMCGCICSFLAKLCLWETNLAGDRLADFAEIGFQEMNVMAWITFPQLWSCLLNSRKGFLTLYSMKMN